MSKIDAPQPANILSTGRLSSPEFDAGGEPLFDEIFPFLRINLMNMDLHLLSNTSFLF
jgi:hypothetical protein